LAFIRKKEFYPRLDQNVGFWLVDDPLVQSPCYRLVVTQDHWGSLRWALNMM
jgi:hypothetical protein